MIAKEKNISKGSLLDHYLPIAQNALKNVRWSLLRKKSVLITGANGLLGSHLIHAIVMANRKFSLGAKVFCISRSGPSEVMQEILKDPSTEFFEMDMARTKPSRLSEKFDYIIHAATYGQPKKFLDNPIETMRLNSSATLNLLEMASASRSSFLFLSSSEVYGNPPREFSPTPEEYPANVSPLERRSSYTAAKVFGETLCKVFLDQGAVRARVARVSSVYGPGARLDDDRVINIFIRRAIDTGKISMMDHGAQKRRWLYISDALVMLFYILFHSKNFVYNVGGSDLVSIRELAQMIAGYTQAKVIVPSSDATFLHTEGAPALVDMDIRRILKESAIGQLVTVKEAIPSCVDWMKVLKH